jgi:hypothetical protein
MVQPPSLFTTRISPIFQNTFWFVDGGEGGGVENTLMFFGEANLWREGQTHNLLIFIV